jgi:hypothetical protein
MLKEKLLNIVGYYLKKRRMSRLLALIYGQELLLCILRGGVGWGGGLVLIYSVRPGKCVVPEKKLGFFQILGNI